MKQVLALAVLGAVLLVTPAFAIPNDRPLTERPADVSRHMFCDTLSQMQRLLKRAEGNNVIAASKAAITVNKEEKATACGIPKNNFVYIVERREGTVVNSSGVYAIFRVKVVGFLHNDQELPRPAMIPQAQYMAAYLGQAA